MQQFISGLIIIAIIGVIVAVCYWMFGGSKVKSTLSQAENKAQAPIDQPNKEREDTPRQRLVEAPTTVAADWYVQQINPKNGKIVKSAPIIVSPSSKFSIGRSSSDDFIIDTSVPANSEVSRHHLYVGRDEKGYFARDNQSSNGTYIDNERKYDTFDLVDNLIVWLAGYPIKFVHTEVDRIIKSNGEDEECATNDSIRNRNQDEGFHR